MIDSRNRMFFLICRPGMAKCSLFRPIIADLNQSFDFLVFQSGNCSHQTAYSSREKSCRDREYMDELQVYCTV